MVHFGHANSFRQAKALGGCLIVGVHSDAEIQEHKSTPPVFTEEERYELVRAIKWVDGVVEAAPYVTTIETLEANNCQYCAHGNDITTTADGTDTYHKVKEADRYREVERTQGVSTTNLLDRMIKASKLQTERDANNNEIQESKNLNKDTHLQEQEHQPPKTSAYTGNSKLILTTQKLLQFSENKKPNPGDKVVYVAGAFDVFNVGHLRFLEKAKELGDYLIVGVYDDATATLLHGPGYPIMTLNERALSLLACKYVSDVVIGAPLFISQDLLDHLNVSVVALGKNGTGAHPLTSQDLYSVARQRNVFQEIDSGCSLTTQDLVARVGRLASEYEERNRRKEEKEAAIILQEEAKNKMNGEVH
jgi:ethanolamine-phosphate cytidylyltransferase